MDTYTSIKEFSTGSSGALYNGRRVFIIEQDPKRPLLYRMSEYQVIPGFKTIKHSVYYGKSRQSEILKQSENMFKV